MTIKLRFSLLLSLFLIGVILTLLGMQRLERAEAEALGETDRQARAQMLNHWFEATTRALPQFAGDLAQAEELITALQKPDREPARAKLAHALAAGRMTWLWVLRDDGTPLWHVAANGVAPVEAPPLAPQEFVALVAQTPNPRFFLEHGGHLAEVCIRRIQPASGEAPARGWVAVARVWDQEQLAALGALTESRVALGRPHEIARAPAGTARVELVRPLLDWQGHPLRVLRLEYENQKIAHAVQSSARQSRVFIAFALLLIVAFGLALLRWVVRPLGKIEGSLASRNAELVAGLAQDKSELGRVAQLVLSSFHHRVALENEITERRRAQEALERSEAALRDNLEERARIGRDLHDGVIQSLYAAGMGLAGIRMQLNPEQTEAAARLEQTRAALNETIHDVRNFIIGLEPEALKLQTFSQAVDALVDTMRNLRPFEARIEIDEELSRRLTLAQRVHALQIAREAISNALRHGEADRIQIALRRRGEFAEFEVSDDGRGFDASATSQGKGLANFAERARELGAELRIESRPGAGARVTLAFSLIL